LKKNKKQEGYSEMLPLYPLLKDSQLHRVISNDL